MSLRPIRRILNAVRDDIADLTTRRALPTETITHLDPFLFLNHHGPQTYPARNGGLPFGPHPHRGFETVTFILEGDIAHKDSGGGESVINEGGIQWMTAGRGLVHSEVSSEVFKRNGGKMEILQLWINLPAKLKMIAPRYVGKQKDQITQFPAADGKTQVSLISGELLDFDRHKGSVEPHYPITLALMKSESEASLRLRVPADQTVFFYVVRGDLEVNGREAKQFQLVEFSQMPSIEIDQDEIEIKSKTASTLLFGHAKPFLEPIVSHGPFVMNTREEIMEAIQDYQSGKLR